MQGDCQITNRTHPVEDTATCSAASDYIHQPQWQQCHVAASEMVSPETAHVRTRDPAGRGDHGMPSHPVDRRTSLRSCRDVFASEIPRANHKPVEGG